MSYLVDILTEAGFQLSSNLYSKVGISFLKVI